MAIDRIPGVGPQNTDIATAVAAAVPTIAAITSSITTNAASAGVTMAAITSSITTNAASAGLTNASITSAGNAAGWGATGPTTTQIAAAVPTLAQITSAITTNAASAGVTVAAITSAGNSAGWGTTGGETWTAISTVNTVGGVNYTYTFSSLSGYKTYRLVFSGCGASGDQTFYFRINGVGGYHWMIRNQQANTASTYGSRGDSIVPLNPTASQTTNRINGYIDFPQANLIGMKAFQGELHSLNSSFTQSNRWSVLGNIDSATAAITSIEFTANNNPFSVGSATLYGGN